MLDHGPGQGRRALTPGARPARLRRPRRPGRGRRARGGRRCSTRRRPLTWISGPSRHQRHRARPGRGRPRPAHPARHPRRPVAVPAPRTARLARPSRASRPSRPPRPARPAGRWSAGAARRLDRWAGVWGRESGTPPCPARRRRKVIPRSDRDVVVPVGPAAALDADDGADPRAGFGARKLGEAIEGRRGPNPVSSGLRRASSLTGRARSAALTPPTPPQSAPRKVPGRAPGVPAPGTGAGARLGGTRRAADTWRGDCWRRIAVVDVTRQVMRAGAALHLRVYRASGGRLMGRTSGLPVLLLTVAGRTTGTPHTTPLVYLDSGGRYVVTGSAGGSAGRAAVVPQPAQGRPGRRRGGPACGPRSPSRSPRRRNARCCGSSWSRRHRASAATRPRWSV